MRAHTVTRAVTIAMLAAAGLTGAVRPASAQSAPVLLVLDGSAVDHGDETKLIPDDAANVAIASVGLRETLPFFAVRVGESATLRGGQAGNDGWFAVRVAPTSWATDPATDDGLQNFALAGPGLGSPDEAGERASQLAAVAHVVPLRAAELNMLIGRSVCGVVYADDIVAGATTNLAGPTLGLAAFRVTSVDGAGSDWPDVTVQVLDTRETCSGAIAAFVEAPDAN